MKRITFFAFLLASLIVGCSGSGNDEPTSQPDRGVKTRMLTITEEATRATLDESTGELTALWTAGDGLAYCNLSTLSIQQTQQLSPASGPLTATTSDAISLFTGEVDCGIYDKLAVVYPAKGFSWYGEKAKYTIPLSGQNGTLSTLATNFHYVYGVATVNSVTDNTANATMPKMKSLLTVCKFSFKDKSNNATIPVQTLTISYAADGTDGNTGTYPQEATVVCETNQSNVHATGIRSDNQLVVKPSTATDEVYVALLPTVAQRSFNFTVTNTSGIYSGIYSGTARATLGEGEFVVATGLKLTKK